MRIPPAVLLPLSLVASLAFASACGGGPFDADRGNYSGTVSGAITASLSGSAYYPSPISDEPPELAMLLTDTDEPILRFVFEGTAVEARTYSVGEVRITFEPNDIREPHYVADVGEVTFTEVSPSVAIGTFSFEAARESERITVTGSFRAEP